MSGPWMQTVSGKTWDYWRDDNIANIHDVAHSLSQINRFTGHTIRPYSVLEHSLLVRRLVLAQPDCTPNRLIYALLHDAHEAYTGDVASPIKQAVGPAWDAFESRVQFQVLRSLGVGPLADADKEAVKLADRQALVLEAGALMCRPPRPWCVGVHAPAMEIEPHQPDVYLLISAFIYFYRNT